MIPRVAIAVISATALCQLATAAEQGKTMKEVAVETEMRSEQMQDASAAQTERWHWARVEEERQRALEEHAKFLADHPDMPQYRVAWFKKRWARDYATRVRKMRDFLESSSEGAATNRTAGRKMQGLPAQQQSGPGPIPLPSLDPQDDDERRIVAEAQKFCADRRAQTEKSLQVMRCTDPGQQGWFRRLAERECADRMWDAADQIAQHRDDLELRAAEAAGSDKIRKAAMQRIKALGLPTPPAAPATSGS